MKRNAAASVASTGASVRQLRVGETMRRILAEMLARGDLPHPDLRRLHITITEARVSPDLRNASIFLLPLGGAETQTALDALEQNRGFLRTQLAAQMHLKRAPALNFSLDPSFDAAKEVDRLLNLPQVARDLNAAAPVSVPSLSPSGWLILDKPQGMSSARAVARIKALSGAAKAGHCGTLDPAAEGVLPIALGEATKLVSFLADASKSYRFKVIWGAATESDDAESEVIARSDIRPKHEDIRTALQDFLGEQMQTPPRYSAVHVKGARAYALARAGESFEVEPRRVSLHGAEFLADESDEDTACFEINCSKGFYVRALARDLGERLGTHAHVGWLRRIRVGMFGEEMSIPLETQADLRHSPGSGVDSSGGPEEKQRLLARLHPLESVLENVPSIPIDATEETRLRQGQAILLSSQDERRGVAWGSSAEPLVALREGKAVALLRRSEEEMKLLPVRVLHWQ